MTDPDIYEAAARAYCRKFDYTRERYVSDEAQQHHIDLDVTDTAAEQWLRDLVDAVVPLIRRQVAAEIRQQSLNWCMDGTGRHLVDNCARIAEGKGDET
jgi:hypothetical protein